jgi:amino acid adenylation domain-containing protein
MKILLTMNLPYTRAYGGANRSNRALAEALAARHHSVCVVAPALAAVSPITHQQFVEELTAEKVRVNTKGEIDVFNLNGVQIHAVVEPSRLCSYVVEQIREFEPDWSLVSSEDRSQSLLEAVLRAHDSRVIYLAHTPQMFPFGPAGLYPGKRRTELIGQTTSIVTISQFVADYIRKWTGFESFVHHPPHYGSVPFPNFGSIENDYVLMMNACGVKGISIFLALARALPDIKFAALPGWGTTNRERAVLSTLPNVVLINNSKNLDDILRRTRVLLMPSLWVEGFGMAVIDAMVRGIPVLAANWGGLIEAKLGTDYLLPVRPIERFEDRLDENLLPVPVVPEQDIHPWQNALSRLVSDGDLYERQSAAAHDAALRFVSRLSIEPLEDLLRRLLTEPNTSPQRFLGKLKDFGSHATVSDIPRLNESIHALTPEQQALLMLRLRKNALSRVKRELPVPPIRPVSRDKELPLSFAQQRLWFLDQYEPNSSVYNIPVAFRLMGSLNVGALEQSLNETIRRHESFRTTFSMVDGETVQVIAPSVGFSLAVVDLRDHPEGEREEDARQLAREEARRPFDLARGPLLRSKLLRLGEDDHVLLLTMHHIVSDGWSMEVFFRELSVLYQAFCSGKPSPFPELPIQYADFAVGQREWLQGEVLDRQLSYWKKQLDNVTPLQLPTDWPRPAVQTYRSGRHSLVLPKDLSAKLRSLSRKEGVTLFMTLLAAFQTLLHRYTGQDDIVVGSPIAGRNLQKIEGLIGLFVNTLVMRTNLSGNPTFRELLIRVREVALEAYAHQDIPFEKVVAELQPERNLSHPPLFQVMFNMINAGDIDLKLSGLRVATFSTASIGSKFDLTVYARDLNKGIRLSLVYNCDLFEEATIRRWGKAFKRLLQALVENPERRVSQLPLLLPDEKVQMLGKFSRHTLKDSGKYGIHQLFEAQVEQSPDVVALRFESQQWTYRQLNNRANQLARHLKRHGVGSDTLIGISLERSPEMVAAILATLKAGCAYVPLDPEYPKTRHAHILNETRIQLLLTKERLVRKFPEFAGKALCLDRDNERFGHESEENLGLTIDPDQLAYVIYTSGSTGKPKGVLCHHRGVVNYFSYLREAYHLDSADTVLQLPSLSFDASVRDLVGPLTAGAQVVLINDFEAKEPTALLAKMQEHGVNCILSIVPTLLNALLSTGFAQGQTCESVRLILISGEALPMTTCQQAKKIFGNGVTLVNQYGPTECTLTSSYHYVTEGDGTRDFAPLGRPIPNARISILDNYLNSVPRGVAGEIHIGGLGLARGYLNSSALTAERFIPDPFNSEPGARLYKTGDRGRYRTDGTLEFLGRLDHQLKIHGFRIEAGEVEAALNQHPSVKESVVVGRDDTSGKQRLVAYVVSNHETAFPSEELRNFLRQKLPQYMVPSLFVFLDKLPLTANRKIDRRALPNPEQAIRRSESAFIVPSTSAEKTVADIWRDLFKLDSLSIDANFFELGGHSLQATQVVARLRKLFQIDLPLRRLFEWPTVGGLARCVERELRVKEKRSPLGPRPVAQYKECPLSFAQQRLWFLAHLEPSSPVYNIPAAFRLAGSLNLAALEQSLNEMVRRHEALRTSFAAVDGQPIQMIAAALSLTVPVVDLSCIAEANRETEALRLASEEAQQPFDLSRLPLLRVRLLRLSEAEHILLLTMHHIVSDGWSLRILFRELSALYRAFSQGRPSPLADLPIQYADFGVWQRERLRGQILENQLAYWKQQLNQVLPALELPTDWPRPVAQRFRGAQQSRVLSGAVTEALKALSRREGVSLFMTLLAAFQILLHRYTGEDDIAVGSPIANRNRPEIEWQIGFFVNTLVLRSNLSGNPTFRELLGQVREVCLDAYEHQDLPFEKLVEELEPQRDMSRNPLFQVMFALDEDPISGFELSDLSLTALKLERGIAKFDLTLTMVEREERLRGVASYSTDLFEGDTIRRMLDHFQTLLEGIAANPDERLSDLPLLTAADRHRLLIDWNDTDRSYPRDKCAHEWFEEQAEQTPNAVALVYESQELTYRELNRRANQLAYYLIRLGVGPESLVALCLHRSIEMVVAVLGVLKSGAAYVPMDPYYPKERLRFMLQDTQAKLILTQSQLLSRLPEMSSDGRPATIEGQERSPVVGLRSIICLDRDWNEIAQQSGGNPDSQATADNLAYVIFTSGSTGKPKGVEVPHRNLINVLSDLRGRLQFDRQDTSLFVANYCFDISVVEILLPLSVGARIVMVSRDVAVDGTQLIDKLSKSRATVMHATPATWRLLLQAGWQGRIRTVLCGGEALELALAEQLASRSSSLWNLYGPTETTIYSSATPCGPEWRGAKVSIGRPIANTRIYLLDSDLQPVPIGVRSELYIGGAGVARGYLNRAELTAEKFVPDPFSAEPGARLYRTGDFARYLPDGNIEYLGRTDHQVKIRGFRIELGEIEAVLSQHRAVREAVVIVRQDTTADKRLVAYVVRKEPALTISGLRDFLKERLPDYMVPTVFVLLDKLPLTPNGKIDRRSLPIPEVGQAAGGEALAAPRNRLEEVLARIWAEVLKLERVGIHDNFFDLGGHSLKAMQLASRIAAATNANISVRLLFAHPTIASFAEAIVDLDASGQRFCGLQVPALHPATNPSAASAVCESKATSAAIEYRPLLSLFAAGKIAPVDAVAIGYLPDALPEQTGLSRAEIIHDWYEELPTLIAISETFLGRIGSIILPLFASELYLNQDVVVRGLIEAMEVAEKVGARMVSLTGLIPSATNYGKALEAVLAGRKDLPQFTTGHATTAAAMVLATEKILREAGRDLAQERIGFLGLGSIGITVLRLMLGCLPHPKEIILCDVYGRREALCDIREETKSALGFRGMVRLVESKQSVPAEFYDATFIVGATNVPEVIDLGRLRPGTILVDDSAPHCFAVGPTLERVQKHADVLFTAGGRLQLPQPMRRLRHLPHFVEKRACAQYLKAVYEPNFLQIGGCVLSSLLSARFPELAPTVGLADQRAGLQYYQRLHELGFQAPELHCRDFVLPEESVRRFRQCFGGSELRPM